MIGFAQKLIICLLSLQIMWLSLRMIVQFSNCKYDTFLACVSFLAMGTLVAAFVPVPFFEHPLFWIFWVTGFSCLLTLVNRSFYRSTHDFVKKKNIFNKIPFLGFLVGIFLSQKKLSPVVFFILPAIIFLFFFVKRRDYFFPYRSIGGFLGGLFVLFLISSMQKSYLLILQVPLVFFIVNQGYAFLHFFLLQSYLAKKVS
ncbi:MAG: hypothetical protein KBD63_05635 [Bacteriovoracaceae bacterium]|nr:hypothetical protein [Bacteriovoracaceae bacterium]